MIILDRVFCDLCNAPMGQLFAAPVQAPGLLADQRLPPYLCACPDCWDASTVESDHVAALQLSGPYTRDEFTDIVTSSEHWA